MGAEVGVDEFEFVFACWGAATIYPVGKGEARAVAYRRKRREVGMERRAGTEVEDGERR